jgi:hypothetical protein
MAHVPTREVALWHMQLGGVRRRGTCAYERGGVVAHTAGWGAARSHVCL